MKFKSAITRIYVCVVTLVLLQFASSVYAINRNDVFAELEKLNTNWDDIAIELWINDLKDEPDPGVLVGDKLIYRVETDTPAFFVLILVDAKGNTAILKPDALSISGITGASETLTFPNEEESESGLSFIEQAEPLGKETIYLLASDQQLPTSVFDFNESADYVNYGTDVSQVSDLIARLNQYPTPVKLQFARYEYYVDSDTQFSSRGIRREISDRVEEIEAATVSTVVASDASSQNSEPDSDVIVTAVPLADKPQVSSPLVINDIQFEYDSDVLTDIGISQLEILGSELVDRQGQNELPRVRLTGHTDSIGPDDYNMNLSKRRSMAAKRFLVDELGLSGEFIDTHGMGESVPIDSNESNDGRARNRRVEFEVVQ